MAIASSAARGHGCLAFGWAMSMRLPVSCSPRDDGHQVVDAAGLGTPINLLWLGS
jgi:hypothetical protein